MSTNLRKTLWGKASGSDRQRGLGQDGRGVQLPGGRFDSPGGNGGAAGGGSEEQSIPSRTGGEAFRDLDQNNRLGVKFALLPPVEVVYSEPFFLGLESEPAGLICVRVLDVLQPDIPVPCGGLAHFTWDGRQALINSIDGLTSSMRVYRLTFLVVG